MELKEKVKQMKFYRQWGNFFDMLKTDKAIKHKLIKCVYYHTLNDTFMKVKSKDSTIANTVTTLSSLGGMENIEIVKDTHPELKEVTMKIRLTIDDDYTIPEQVNSIMGKEMRHYIKNKEGIVYIHQLYRKIEIIDVDAFNRQIIVTSIMS